MGRRPRTHVRSAAQISFNMSRVRSTGSEIERVMQAAFRRARLRPEAHALVVGRPDFAFPRLRVAVFCDSHFWHGYRWQQQKTEVKRNRSFWLPKIEGNIRRDREVNRSLRAAGWIVLRFWEHEIFGSADDCVAAVKRALAEQRAGGHKWQS